MVYVASLNPKIRNSNPLKRESDGATKSLLENCHFVLGRHEWWVILDDIGHETPKKKSSKKL